jgi:hypothetical protein
MNEIWWWGAELLVWIKSHGLVASAVGAALLLPGLACCWAARRGAVVSRQALTRIDQRLAHICSAVELLTDTTEASLKAAFAEIERLSAAQREADALESLHQRVRAAARHGRTAREIAQAEGVSEGEVRLRLRLYGDERAALSNGAMAQSSN